jgi:uncharacterized protein YcnI
MKLGPRIPVAFSGAAGLVFLVFAAPAWAHVTANPGEAAAGGYTYHAFRVGHGCDGSPTTKVAVSIPDGVVSVKPQEVTGWTIAITRGPITPYDNHGETVAEGVKEVSWTGGPLPDDHMQQFGLSMKMPDKPGETIYFPVVQTCQQGVTRWIDIPVAGQDEPETPAASVKLLAKAAAHGAKTETGTEADATPVSQSGEVRNDDGDTLAVIALVIGSLALVAGGLSLFRKLRRP